MNFKNDFYKSLENVNINNIAKNQLRSLGMKTSCEENTSFVINPSDENCKALIEHPLFLKAVQDVLGYRNIDGKHLKRNYLAIDEITFEENFIRRALLVRRALDKNDTKMAKLYINFLIENANELLMFSNFKPHNSEIDYKSSNEDNLMELSRWLMGYVMELHDFRRKLTKKEYLNNMPEEVKNIIIMNFPMLQGSSNHTRFKKLGINNFNQNKVKKAVQYIEKQLD